MKFRQITLQQADNDDDKYIVHRLADCMEPKVGSVLTPEQVQELIGRTYTKVIILRAKS